MDIASAIQQLGKQMGIALSLDANHTCRLIFDGRTAIDIEAPEPKESTVFFHALVGLVPSGNRERLYQTLLEANLFGRGTGGAVLAVDAGRQEVILFLSLDMAVTDYPAFTKALEDFLAQTIAWTERLRAESRQDAAPSVVPGESFLRV